MRSLLGRQARERGIFSRVSERWFPTPKGFLTRGAGIDISDASIKWLSLEPYMSGFKVKTFGTAELPVGAVVNGIIKDKAMLVEALTALRKTDSSLRFAHAALPEEAGYVFTMQVPLTQDRAQVLSVIEFGLEDRIPLSPSQAVFDYDVVTTDGGSGQAEIVVVAFPKDIPESYSAAFAEAGIELLSLEIEPRSIARAISIPGTVDTVELLIDFGRTRTGLAILQNGLPIFTSTVEIGGDGITKLLMERLSVSKEDAENFKNEHGIFSTNEKGAEAITGVAAALADEVARLYHYWDTRRDDRGNRIASVSRVVLAGGSSNLKGLPEYIASKVQSPTERAEMWRNVCDPNEYIPPIDRRASFSYATAVGLALRSAL